MRRCKNQTDNMDTKSWHWLHYTILEDKMYMTFDQKNCCMIQLSSCSKPHPRKKYQEDMKVHRNQILIMKRTQERKLYN
jgi:hypothetical protein